MQGELSLAFTVLSCSQFADKVEVVLDRVADRGKVAIDLLDDVIEVIFFHFFLDVSKWCRLSSACNRRGRSPQFLVSAHRVKLLICQRAAATSRRFAIPPIFHLARPLSLLNFPLQLFILDIAQHLGETQSRTDHNRCHAKQGRSTCAASLFFHWFVKNCAFEINLL